VRIGEIEEIDPEARTATVSGERLEGDFVVVALGAELAYRTLDSDEEITITPGTQTGSVIRLRHRGVPRVDGRGRVVHHEGLARRVPGGVGHVDLDRLCALTLDCDPRREVPRSVRRHKLAGHLHRRVRLGLADDPDRPCEAADRIATAMIITAAMIEGAALFAIVVGLMAVL